MSGRVRSFQGTQGLNTSFPGAYLPHSHCPKILGLLGQRQGSWRHSDQARLTLGCQMGWMPPLRQEPSGEQWPEESGLVSPQTWQCTRRAPHLPASPGPGHPASGRGETGGALQ